MPLTNIMTRLLLFVFLMLPTHAEDLTPNILGSWRSDAVATNAYLLKHANLNDIQKKFFAKFFGRAVVTYKADGTGFVSIMEVKAPMGNGEELKLESAKVDFKYEVLGTAKSQIIIKTTMGEETLKDYPFTILNFVDDDNYSVSIPESLSDINGREFFKRVKTQEGELSEDGKSAEISEKKPEADVAKKRFACDSHSFLVLAKMAEAIRDDRRLTEKEFAAAQNEPGVVILDARGAEFFAQLHVIGAKNLPYTHFSSVALEKLIPKKDTKILIYCRNNFHIPSDNTSDYEPPEFPKGVGVGLNIPTFITLKSYGYDNVWELDDVVNPNESVIPFYGKMPAE